MTIYVFDNYIETPCHDSFNRLVANRNLCGTYHVPSQFGFESTEGIPNPTAIILFGSGSNIDERLSWHRDLAEFTDKWLQKGVPCLGICFGHQLMADFYGGEIADLNEDRSKFSSYREIEVNKNLKKYKRGMTFEVGFSHMQVVKSLPDSMESIAHSALSDYEIIRHKTLPFLSIQAHPEAACSFLKEYSNVEDPVVMKHLQQQGDRFIDLFFESFGVV